MQEVATRGCRLVSFKEIETALSQRLVAEVILVVGKVCRANREQQILDAYETDAERTGRARGYTWGEYAGSSSTSGERNDEVNQNASGICRNASDHCQDCLSNDQDTS
jgi:hypothetical protein